MKTYYIDVENVSSASYAVKAESAEKAIEEAMKRFYEDLETGNGISEEEKCSIEMIVS